VDSSVQPKVTAKALASSLIVSAYSEEFTTLFRGGHGVFSGDAYLVNPKIRQLFQNGIEVTDLESSVSVAWPINKIEFSREKEAKMDVSIYNRPKLIYKNCRTSMFSHF
jgi:hypothetical protein